MSELMHYGVKGMKWGIRRFRRNSKPEYTSRDHRRKMKLKKKKISQMSNDELRELTNRLQLEKQYKDLKRSEVSYGRKLVEDVLKDVGKELIKEAIRKSAKSGASILKNSLK